MYFLDEFFKFSNDSFVCGLTDELAINYILSYYRNNSENVLVLANSLYEANKIFQRLQTYVDDVCFFPMDDFLASVAIAKSPDLKVKRLETIEYIKNHNKSLVVTNLMGYLHFVPKDSDNSLNFTFKVGDSVDRDELLNKLQEIGYRRESLVSSTGEFSVRGFIVDIFPIESDNPIRVEFFGDVIESIRYFSADTQLSMGAIDYYKVLPVDEVSSAEHQTLSSFMDNPVLFCFNYNQVQVSYEKLEQDIFEYKVSKNIEPNYKFMYSFDEIQYLKLFKIESLNDISGSISYNSKPILKFNGDYDKFKDYCYDMLKKGYMVVICLSNNKQIETISSMFESVCLDSVVDGKINILHYRINEGFVFEKYVVISEYDIDDIKVVHNYKSSYKMGKKIKDFSDLQVGDYVVHAAHGIGIYSGIVPIEKNGMIRDYIMIQYFGNDKVYIPVEKISTIYKYSGGYGTAPVLNKLNSSSWAKTKMKVSKRIHDMSEELIKLYAARASIKGISYVDIEDEEVFGSLFQYNETSDQLKCIKEINMDLKRDIPMDRLLCGDVGFGKTEVAFRGMFKTVMNGFQVAYLCPTTLLSRQQYNNALARFANFPINIALLNRFTSAKEVSRIFDGLQNGSIDIVIGTHKLLNEKIVYKNLGLLVIDEEQRFGVSHKEKIKEMKNDVNVLTLSATPIPRTLKMAMSGLRDLSIIDTPPVNRYPVQTYVMEENELLIRDAIYKELSRDGQVFIVYNRVESIENIRTMISSLVPDANIAVAHGQMDKGTLEDIVIDFIDNKYNILISTTIIETGIDIPNVNTLIILDSDMFGLSQLYQLRGRVGRSDKIAYAYLMYKPYKVLTETALKRLQSIKDFTELGSGYKIAMRDLSIRGAGDLLGSEQAGFVDTIGLELYTEMVNNELKRLKGEEVIEEDSSNPLIEVSNHIEDSYVSEESVKIEIHKLINSISDYDSLQNVKDELTDRFGRISNEMEIYMYEEWFEKIAQKLGISRVIQSDTVIEVELPIELSNKIQGDKLFLVAYNINPRFKLSYRMRKIYLSLPKINLEKHFIYYIVDLLNEISSMTNNS